MLKFFKNIKSMFNKLWLGLGVGLKTTEDKFLHQDGANHTLGTSINKQIEEKRLSLDLMKGEVTQETEELAWRTYNVERESNDFEFFSGTLAKRKDESNRAFESNRIKVDNSENAKIVTIQENWKNSISLADEFSNINLDDIKHNKYGNEYWDVKNINHDIEYTININRNYIARFKIEQFLKKLVVKVDKEDENKFYLDFYFSVYDDGYDIKSKQFITELKNIKETNYLSDTLDIKSIEFITKHAYSLPDMLKFSFHNFVYKKIIEYDGNYVVKFEAEVTENGVDLVKKHKSESMEKKYAENAPRTNTVEIDLNSKIREYTCEECGKKVTYDAGLGTNVMEGKPELEYLDLELAEQTFGKKLCKECFEKKQLELYNNFKGKSNIHAE